MKTQLLTALVVLAGCSGMEKEKIETEQKAAAKAPLVDKSLGFGFSVDLPRQVANEKAAAVEGTPQMTVRLLDGSELTARNLDLGFARDTLAELEVVFIKAEGREYRQLQELLAQRNGKPGLANGPAYSWFRGRVETCIEPITENGGIVLHYRDHRRYRQRLNEQIEEQTGKPLADTARMQTQL